MMSDRRKVEAPNYAVGEGSCSCGCGKQSGDAIILACQALVRILVREQHDSPVQHRVSGGARCKAKNDATPGSAKYSLHLLGAALDGTFWTIDPITKEWAKIPCARVAAVAKRSGLFGGIGWAKYGGEFIHLDVRPGPMVEW